MKHKQLGTTLIELMVVVVIVAILAAFAYPTYRDQVFRSRRSEAKAALMQVAVLQEKFFLQNNSYAAALNTANLGAHYTVAKPNTEHGFYSLSMAATATTYTVTATAQNGQQGDSHCATLTINQTGTHGGTNTDCW